MIGFNLMGETFPFKHKSLPCKTLTNSQAFNTKRFEVYQYNNYFELVSASENGLLKVRT